MLPNSFFATLPIFNPRKVKEKLTIENIIKGNMDVLMVEVKPIPVIKLSILTNIDSSKRLIIFVFISISLLKIKSFNNLKNKNKKIKPNNLLAAMGINVNSLSPSILPIIGNMKWKIPTIKGKKYVLLFLDRRDIPNDKEKVSILNASAIKNELVKDIKNHPI